MNVAFLGLISVIVIVLAFWFFRSKNRPLKNVDAEAARLTPTSCRDLADVCMEVDADALADSCRKVWERAGGIRGLIAIEKNSRAIVRVLGAAVIQYGDFLKESDSEYIESRVFGIRNELPMLAIEAAWRALFGTPSLHALRTAQLYCEIVGRISAVAEHHALTGLTEALNAL